MRLALILAENMWIPLKEIVSNGIIAEWSPGLTELTVYVASNFIRYDNKTYSKTAIFVDHDVDIVYILVQEENN